MHCPYCGHEETRVLDSRPAEEGAAIRRRRECVKCTRRFTTYERVDATPLMVVKRDGRREPFDRQKILTGLVRACQKRPISTETLAQIALDVEREIRNLGEHEISSLEIGERVIERLRHLDEVAFVRFASVYRRVTRLESLVEEIESLRARKQREEELRSQVLLPLGEDGEATE
ncbi:MAG: transcriptional repressor NrdR [Armatimonadetes bacterium]|nr:transcriptional repressor NrdR [Armatimonadota bacterium]